MRIIFTFFPKRLRAPAHYISIQENGYQTSFETTTGVCALSILFIKGVPRVVAIFMRTSFDIPNNNIIL